ncbi:hypothetical protein SAMN04515647_4491 [Cohaesibacter sp. ES.047]|uniref:hypothetical protein n=1 Tax=Cohaesibacter sp. ES.047 TaxID=1798205 RepID=UPI000BB7ADF7|nr:hypothetical protein [Cohaesibacter sp. ES.047]SNY94167.1 hypothetical protein SAMN04515647_4491 [Cohaesibacter sp. ES.047]
MKRPDLSNRTVRPVQIILRCLLLILTIAVLPGNAAAQQADQPLNLGEVIQKESRTAAPPPSYIKLPETIQLPTAKPAQGATPESAAETTDQTDPAAQSAEGTESQDPLLAPIPGETTQPEAPVEPEIQPGGIARLQLAALLSDEGEVLRRGIDWRIYEEKRDENGQLPLIQDIEGGPIQVELETGKYIIYAGYGFANLTKRIVLDKAGDYAENFNLQAGAVRLNAVATGDIPLDNSILSFDIYTRDKAEGEAQKRVAENVKPNHVIKLTEGTYHIVSSYGTSNAKVRGDVEISAGKLVNVTMIHNAAKVTLRLVSEPGGEALANTIWTVLTPGGDVVKRAIGAFPTLALTAGDYTAIAKQNNEVYNRDFSVDSGLDRDIEVLATVR